MLIVVAASVIGGLSAALCLSQMLEPDQLRETGWRIRHWQFTIRQMMVAIIVTGLVFHMFTSREGWFSFTLLCIGFLLWFVRCWQKEFVFLMGRGDADFPGRHDKLTWAIMLMVFAPVGVWFFRAYRLAHWPEPAPATVEAGPATEPGGPAAQPA